MSMKKGPQSGFSMIELLITLLILSVGLLGLLGLQVMNIRGAAWARNRATATALAEGCLSSIQAEGATTWVQGTSLPTTYPRVYTGTLKTGGFGSYDANGASATGPTGIFTVNWERLDGATDPATAISGGNGKEFVVWVTWTDQIGQNGAVIPSKVSLSRWIRYS